VNSGNSFLNILFERLEKIICTETVIGEPFQVGSITLIPLITVSLGVGGREGSGKGKKHCSDSDYGVAGCNISPHAILIIKNEEVSVLPLTEKGSLERIVEMLPEIISTMDCFKDGNEANKSKD
jgi:uncharacterized spore protein YtfJ